MKLVVDKESLVSVADAIRSKGGTNEELEFPNGFVDGINAIESGGGGTEEIENIIDASGVLDSTEGTVTDKVEQLIDYANFKNIIQESLYNAEGSSAYNMLSVFKNTSVEDVSMFDFSKVKYIGDAFMGTKIKELDIDVSSAISMNNFIRGSTEINKIVLRNMTTKTTGLYHAFYLCENLKHIETLNIGGCTDNVYGVGNAFDGCMALEEIRFVPECIKVSITIPSPVLSNESIKSILRGLAPVETTRTLKVATEVYNKLFDNELYDYFDEALTKGWDITA